MMAHGAIVYDYLLCQGGAERLSLELARGLEADLYSAFRDRDAVSDEWLEGVTAYELAVTLSSHPVWRALRTSRLFERRGETLANYEWVVFGGSYAPFAVSGRFAGRNIYYCHTPPRFVYDLRDWYLDGLPVWQRPMLKGLIAYFQPRYEAVVGRMDRLVANSENVRRRLREYLGVESQVAYPPCNLDRWRWLGEGEYYLSTARLEPYKRVDRIIEAFRRMPRKRLVVASGGSEEGRLRRLAADAPNIEFVGWVDDERLRELVGGAVATLYLPRDEDFGMSPVESMAAGKPVIGVAEGGLLETVVDGESGVLLSEVTVERLVEAVMQLTPARASALRGACEAQARRFGSEQFVERMREIVG